MSKRKIAFFCNLAIIALCLASIIAYFVMPFWKVDIKYTFTPETIQTLLPTTNNNSGYYGDEDYDDEDESGLVDAEDILSTINFADLIDEDITIQMSISLQTKDILSARTKKPTALVRKILQDNVNTLVDQLEAPLNKLVKNTLKVVVKTAFLESVKDEVKKKMDDGVTNAELNEELEELGLTENYINKKTEKLLDCIYEDGATAESIADETISVIEDAIQKIKESGNPDYKDIKLTKDEKADIKEALIEQFEKIESSDGTINPEAFTSEFFLKLLNGDSLEDMFGNNDDGDSEDEDNEDSSDDPFDSPILKNPKSSNGLSNVQASSVKLSANNDNIRNVSSSEEATKQQLRQALTNKIMELLNGTEESIAMAITGISSSILVIFAIWLLPILKILLRLGCKNNTIKLGTPIWLGSTPYIMLCLVPSTLVSLLNNPPAAAGELLSGLGGALGNLSITFTSCSIVSFIVGIILSIFVFVFYGRLRRAVRAEARAAANMAVAAAPAPMDEIEENEPPKAPYGTYYSDEE